jgi:hypothetical protein
MPFRAPSAVYRRQLQTEAYVKNEMRLVFDGEKCSFSVNS